MTIDSSGSHHFSPARSRRQGSAGFDKLNGELIHDLKGIAGIGNLVRNHNKYLQILKNRIVELHRFLEQIRVIEPANQLAPRILSSKELIEKDGLDMTHVDNPDGSGGKRVVHGGVVSTSMLKLAVSFFSFGSLEDWMSQEMISGIQEFAFSMYENHLTTF